MGDHPKDPKSSEGLVSLDAVGGEESAPYTPALDVETGPVSLSDLADLPTAPAPPARPPIPAVPRPEPPAPAVDAHQFAPPKDATSELQLEKPVLRVARMPPADLRFNAPAGTAAEPAPRPEPRERPTSGGGLRDNPLARYGIGIVLALVVGYFVSAPYSGRAEKRIADLRANAAHERARGHSDGRAEAQRLEAQAEKESQNGAVGSMAIWLLVGAAAFAGWLKAT